MRAKSEIVWFFGPLLFSEIASSFWRLLNTPADGPIDTSLFRLPIWAIVAFVVGSLWFMIGRGRTTAKYRGQGRQAHGLGVIKTYSIPVFFLIAFLIECLTSLLFWKSSWSASVQHIYQSAIHWRGTPRPTDYEWLSFRGYLIDHGSAWIVFFAIAVALGFLFSKKPVPESSA